MGVFDNKRKNIPITVRTYEEEVPLSTVIKDWIHDNFMVVLIAIASIAVIGIVITIFSITSQNNPVDNFVRASSKNVSDGGFDFTLVLKNNGEDILTYEGGVSFDERRISLNSRYDAIYPTYKYTNVTYTDLSSKVTYNGNLYKDKWTIEDNSSRVRDFYDFFTDYKVGVFDANAYVSFTDQKGEYRAPELKKTIDRVLKEFRAGISSTDVCKVSSTENGKLYTFTPDLDDVFNIILNNNASSFRSANIYEDFKAKVENSQEILKNADMVLSYVISDDGYLESLNFTLVNGEKSYEFDLKMSNFGNPTVVIPKEFFEAAEISEENINGISLATKDEATPQEK